MNRIKLSLDLKEGLFTLNEGIIEALVGVQAQSGSPPYDPVIYK